MNAVRKTRLIVRALRLSAATLIVVLAVTVIVGTDALLARWAQVQLAAGNHDTALRTLKGLTPTTTVSLLTARALFHKQEFGESVRLFSSVGPETQADLEMLGRGLAALGRWTEAANALRVAHEQGCNDPELLQLSVAILTAIGRYDEAMSQAESLAQHRESLAVALFAIGNLHRDRGHGQKFIETRLRLLDLPETAQRVPVSLDILRAETAETCVLLSDFRTAGELLKDLPETSQTSFLKGEVFADAGDSAAAAAAWKRAVELDPTSVAPRSRLAHDAFAGGRTNDALSLLQPVAEQRERLPRDVCHLLRLIYASLGEAGKAAEWKEISEAVQLHQKKSEQLLAIASGAASQNDPYRSRVICSWKLASQGLLPQAADMISRLEAQIPAHLENSAAASYVHRLAAAIRSGGPLPDPTEMLPELSDEHERAAESGKASNPK